MVCIPARSQPDAPRCRGASVAVCLAAAVLPAAGAAEEGEPFPPPAAAPPARVELEELMRGEERRPLNLYAGVGFVSKYVSRGLVFLDEPSLQPWIELDLPLLRSGSDALHLDSLTLFAGTWANINVSGRDDGVARTGRAATLEDWYEADVYAGLRTRLTEHLTSSLRYNFYTSPSNSFRDIHEIDWRVAYDGGPLWRRWWDHGELALLPALRVAKEIHDAGGPDNTYVQPSLTPTWRVPGLPLPVTASVPLILGFGADGQYLEPDGDERHFGFFQTGLAVAVDLDLLPERRGSLTLSVGVDHVVLSDDDLGTEGRGSETVGRAGLSYSF